ncbi:MAG: UvrD-helicase domain-containing protein, partial [Myxococcota bacterium]
MEIHTRAVLLREDPADVVSQYIEQLLAEDALVLLYRTVRVDGQSAFRLWLGEQPDPRTGELKNSLVTFVVTGEPGIAALPLSADLGMSPLVIGETYYWEVMFFCEPDSCRADHYAQGWVQRIEVDAATAQQLAAADPSPATAARWVTSVGHPALVALSRLTAPSGGGPFVQRQLLPFLERFEAPSQHDDPLRIYEAYREVLALLMSDTDQLRTLTHPSVLGTQASWPGQRRYQLAKRATKALVDRLGDWADRARAAHRLPTPADRALLEALEPFSRWILSTEAQLTERMNTERVLTFEELQLRAIRAVQRDETLREFLWARHTAIMVDEFQDTDELQWSLVLALGRRHADVPEGRLFLVGDVKQAIYGFRGGDVTVFRRAAEELGVQPLRLPDNFRSKPELIRWFNDAFPHVLGTDPSSPHDAPYEAIRAGRTDMGGRVTLLRGDTDTLGGGWQAETVARLIAVELLAPDSPFVDIDAFPTPPIALLLRARTRQAEFEAALRRQHVPFVVAEGVGFWGRQEVIDIVNTVSAVVHADPASIVAALRGPWLGLTDQAIQAIARPGR